MPTFAQSLRNRLNPSVLHRTIFLACALVLAGPCRAQVPVTVLSGTRNGGASDAITASDNGNVVVYSTASSATTLPKPNTSGIRPGFNFIVAPSGSGTVTITPTSATIN